MEKVKKWLCGTEVIKKNGLYVHYSLPKALGAVSSEQLRKWARGGEEGRLERAVLAGHGHRLLADADTLPLSRHLHNLIVKCDALHAAVEKGSLLELQELLASEYNRNKYVACFDESGVGLLHKAVYYNYLDIAEWLVSHYPRLVHQKDSEGRIALHYTAACRDEAQAAALLERAGAARGSRDAAGRTLAHYRAARTLLALPNNDDGVAMPARPSPPNLVIKRHNIRIWCHECDMGRLQRVVWEGHGARLLSEVSNQPVVKKFLEAVPYIMNTIRDTHNAVIQNDLEGIMKLTADPVSPQVFSSRDVNNMTVLHKAAGLGHGSILKYIIEKYPQGINDVDNDGRTPLHYAATVKDEQHTYNTLVGFGADESVVDNKNKTPGYYINRPQEIDKNLLKVLPDAPRTPSSAYPTSWDWKILSTDFIADLNKKSRKKNLKASNENISSKKATSTISDSLDNHTNAMKGSSTHELISNLPELDDTEKGHVENTKENNTHENKDHPDVVDETNNQVKDQEKTEDPVTENAANNNSNSENGDKSEMNQQNNNIEETTDPVPEEKEESLENKNSSEATNENKNSSEVIKDEQDHDRENVKHTEDENKENESSSDNNHEIGSETKDPINNQDKSNLSTENENNSVELQESSHESDKVTENHEESSNNENIGHQDKQQENDKIQIKADETTVENTDENNQENDNEIIDSKENKSAKEEDPTETSGIEGNYHCDPSEDDDDVQAQGDDYHSDHSGDNNECDPTVTENGLSKGGNPNHGRNSQESLIEGVISGDAEQDSQDASMTRRRESVQGDILIVDNEIDPEVTELINTTNMEMLATLVLNGEGSRLLGRHSGNSELQAFLENVPVYMQKINKVHLAAKEGNLRDLQAALDRRKFAIARDPISPNGATPLHVATVFGKTNIMKYLGGRFPETLSAVDFEGRTALHYAAVLPDNGHYYNLLKQLGANSKDLDDNGRSAEDYFKNPTLLPFNQLLIDYGISEEEAKNMLSDKGLNHATNGHMDIPIFHTEEGRYLAKSLGDPLIKGLTEVANVKPKDPIAFLASFLHNFPDQEKPRLGTQESNTLVTEEDPEVENEELPPAAPTGDSVSKGLTRSAARTTTRPHRPIDVVTVDPQADVGPDVPEAAVSSDNRDEHGQSMLHFAAARPHTNNALFQLLQESDVSLGYRDELYRTARDVSIQANVPENTVEIDKWVLHLAARGQTDKIMELLLQGYDHILDVVDEEGAPITEVVSQRGDSEMSNLLASIPAFEESRESLHGAIRRGDLSAVREAVAAEGGRTLACAQNSYARTSLHVAVLAEHEDIVAYLAETCPELLRMGDNLERTPLHYAMGVDKIESLSRILIRSGAKRVLKDLKGRQPSYYFMNKSDILRLKEEESTY